ncbi:MAG: hypothetical protein AB2A00_33280 [Myxococcota bacterium]
MSVIRSGGLPPALVRDRQLSETARRLGNEADREMGLAGKSIKEAGRHGEAAGTALGRAVDNVADATFTAGRAVGNTAKGVGAAILGGVSRVASEVTDALGAALQWLGKGLIGLGNKARDVSGMGGPQITTATVLGDPRAELFSDRMFKLSHDAFEVAGNQWVRSVDHLVSAGGDLAKCAKCVVAAAEKTAEAAAHVGNAAALKAAQGSVILAKEALMAAERGVDGAGALLQQAGRAVISAGNAVNTARGNDTALSGG